MRASPGLAKSQPTCASRSTCCAHTRGAASSLPGSDPAPRPPGARPGEAGRSVATRAARPMREPRGGGSARLVVVRHVVLPSPWSEGVADQGGEQLAEHALAIVAVGHDDDGGARLLERDRVVLEAFVVALLEVGPAVRRP